MFAHLASVNRGKPLLVVCVGGLEVGWSNPGTNSSHAATNWGLLDHLHRTIATKPVEAGQGLDRLRKLTSASVSTSGKDNVIGELCKSRVDLA